MSSRVSAAGFGLELRLPPRVELPELPEPSASNGAEDDPVIDVILGDVDAREGARVFTLGDPEDPHLSVSQRSIDSYVLAVRDYGAFGIDAASRTIVCDSGSTGSRWQDALVAQALPFSAVLLGREVFHASAVTGPSGGATLIVAASGTGKSTLAAYLAARGHRLLADDAVSVTLAAAGQPLAHSGSRWVQVSAADAETILSETRGAALVGEREGKTTVQLPSVEPGSYPIKRLLLLRRSEGLGRPQVSAAQASPAALLGSSLTQTVQTPRRRVHQLDVSAAIAHRAEVLDVAFGSETSPAALADHLISGGFVQ